MQTFLPDPDFKRSMQLLDPVRLRNQRRETITILNVLQGKTHGGGWRHHPATLMWRGYEGALELYLNENILECLRRGYVNNVPFRSVEGPTELPYWLGDEALHSSHRAALLFKDVYHYARHHWTEEPIIEYYWPMPKD